jgi:hypothetical protein
MNNKQNNHQQSRSHKKLWENIKKKPWVSQALWVLPIVGWIKNLWEVLAGRDSITERNFTTKEQLFKGLSGVCFLGTRWIAWYNSYYTKDIFDTMLLMVGLQGANRTSYGVGVYYSGELEKILQYHKENVSKKSQIIISRTKKIVVKKYNNSKNKIE